jgi:hypothetical protein
MDQINFVSLLCIILLILNWGYYAFNAYLQNKQIDELTKKLMARDFTEYASFTDIKPRIKKEKIKDPSIVL